MIMSFCSTSASSSHLLNTPFPKKGFAKALSSTHVTPPPQAKRVFRLPNWRSSVPGGGGPRDRQLQNPGMERQLRDTFDFLKQMVHKGYAPKRNEAKELLYGLLECSRVDLAARVLELTAAATGRSLNGPEITHVVDRLCSRGNVGRAMHLVDKMETLYGLKPSINTYNVLARGISNHGNLSQGLQLVERLLRRGIVPDKYTFSYLLQAASKERGVDEAKRLLEELLAKGAEPNVDGYNIILKGLCKEDRFDDAVRLFRSLPSKGIQPDVFSYSILLRPFILGGRWGDAEELLAEMRSRSCSPNRITYNTLISSLCMHGLTNDALQVLDEMVHNGFQPHASSYNPIVARFCKIGDVAAARDCLHSMLHRHRLVPDDGTYNAVAQLCDNPPGLVREAFNILQMLCDNRGNCSVHNFYNRVVSDLCHLGSTFAAFQLLPEMVPAVFTPAVKTYSSLLRGLCEEGMVDKAMELIEIMENEGVVTVDGTLSLPHFDNYNTLIAKLCKMQRTDLAIEVYLRMVNKGVMPREITYSILVEGIARCNELQLAAKVLMELHRRDMVTMDTVDRMALQFGLEEFLGGH